MEKKKDKELVLDLLREHPEGVTPFLAYVELGILTSLRSRISDLRRDGYPIRTKMEAVQTKRGKRTSIARYTLES